MDLERDEIDAVVSLPVSMAAALVGYQLARDSVGQSGSAVYRLHSNSDTPDLFLKYGTGVIADEITDEMVRLRWLAKHLSVPNIQGFSSTPGEAWLLMTAIPGKTAYQSLQEEPDAQIAIVDELARFLRRLHAIPVSDCPFISDQPRGEIRFPIGPVKAVGSPARSPNPRT